MLLSFWTINTKINTRNHIGGGNYLTSRYYTQLIRLGSGHDVVS